MDIHAGMLRSRDQRGLETTFLVSVSVSHWSWFQPRSHEVMVSGLIHVGLVVSK